MEPFITYLIQMAVLVVCFQIYLFVSSKKGEEKQTDCQRTGIVFMTLGMVALCMRTTAYSITGLILIMMGFRLMARGLDRLDKTRFIDRLEDDE